MRHPFLSPTVAMIIGLSAMTPRPVLAQQVADPTPLPQVAYQGRLLEGGVPVTGARVFVFSILDSTGHELWNSGNQTLTVDVGLYGVVLGSTGMTPIPSSVLGKSGLLLRVAIGGTPLTPDVDILPAFQARSAWELVGAFSGDLTGTQNQTLVSNLQGIPLDLTTTAPTTGQALVFNGSKWIAGSVAGTPGPQGPKGDKGDKGDQGIQGNTGAQGIQGPIGLTGNAGAAGSNGTNGTNGLDGKTILNGVIAPLASQGVDGDFFLNTVTSTLYGPKTAGAWPAGVLLIGPTGAAGAPGATGAQGIQGIQGNTGAQGIQGIQGNTGATGASPFTLNGSDAVFTTGSLGLGINPPNASALLDLTSTTKGFLPPRMTAVQRAAIVTPTAGLMVYQTDGTAGLYQYDGSVWSQVGAAGVGSVSGTAPVTVTGTTAPVISMAKATGSVDGYLAASDFATFAAKGSGTVTSVGIDTGTTGLTASSAITSSGTITLAGTLAVANGGTGQTTAAAAFTALAPSQGTNSGKFLTTNGTAASWAPVKVNSDGGFNTLGGTSALLSLSSGTNNTAFGYSALVSVTTGGNNVAVGSAAGYALTSGGYNTALGTQALWGGDGAVSSNVGVGDHALFSPSTGADENVAVGCYALSNTSFTGAKNVGLGRSAGNAVTSGANNIFIGYGANTTATTASNQIALGAGAYASAANQMVIGGDNSAGWKPAITSVIPGATNTADLGSTASRWKKVYAGDVDVTGSFTINGAPLGGGSGTVTSVAALTLGTAGTDLASSVATGTTTPVITLNVPTASASNRGALSAADWTTFNGKAPLASPTFTGTPTAPTATAGTNTTQLATTQFVTTAAASATGLKSATTSVSVSAATAPSSGQVLTATSSTTATWQTPAGGSSLPTQTGNAGKVLVTNGTNPAWSTLTDANSNTSVGGSNLPATATGTDNTALGYRVLSSLTTGWDNVGVGNGALNKVTIAASNTAVGTWSVYRGTGDNNSAFGAETLLWTTSGANNSAFGFEAGTNLTTGSNNLFMGYLTGPTLTTGTYNVLIGNSANVSAADATNRIAIGAGAAATLDNQMVIGGDGVGASHPVITEVIPGKGAMATLGSASNMWTEVYASNGTINTSDARVKTNLQPIPSGLGTLLKLQPLTYFKHKSHFENGAVVLENEGTEEAGFLAQEVSGIIPTAVHRPDDESKVLWGVRTDQVIPYTVKAVQELKAENDQLRSELETMKAELAEIKALLKR
jgi:hypothetical protein